VKLVPVCDPSPAASCGCTDMVSLRCRIWTCSLSLTCCLMRTRLEGVLCARQPVLRCRKDNAEAIINMLLMRTRLRCSVHRQQCHCAAEIWTIRNLSLTCCLMRTRLKVLCTDEDVTAANLDNAEAIDNMLPDAHRLKECSVQTAECHCAAEIWTVRKLS
jgi:hypothetical protein